ncbi:MAG: ABC transporter substrate-binding protein [Eggerthellaceae bacterium]|nr:ABC transporter substrate-binding protein [Eggerthellaceae bacterium]
MKLSLGWKKNTMLAALLALTACLMGGLLVGCTTQEEEGPDGGTAVTEAPEQTSVTFTDDLGNSVTLDRPERVVACMGSFANIWELAGGTLIGATDDAFEDFTLSSPGVEKVGYFTEPSLEAIIALEADFVIMTGASTGRDGSASQVDLQDALRASGIEVAYFNVTVFEDYLRMLRTCCDITGRDDLYAANGEAVEQQIADIRSQAVASADEPTVMLMTTYSGGTRVQDSSTMTGTMLAELGARNLADENQSLLRDFSLESVIDLNPDFILVVPMGNDDAAAMRNLEEATAANPAWATLDAVKNGRYVTLDKVLFLYKPNANWGESYQALYDILYA